MTATGSDRPWRRRLRIALRQFEHALAIFGVGMLVYLLGFDVSRMTSDSMSPTLQGTAWEKGDLLLSERFSYWFRRPRRWEVITFRRNDGARVMKRVVGLPGEAVQVLVGGKLVINGQRVEPPERLAFLRYIPCGNVMQDKKVNCGDGYYVLGDEPIDSDDSRFNGCIDPSCLIGRAWLILAPADRRGFVP